LADWELGGFDENIEMVERKGKRLIGADTAAMIQCRQHPSDISG